MEYFLDGNHNAIQNAFIYALRPVSFASECVSDLLAGVTGISDLP